MASWYESSTYSKVWLISNGRQTFIQRLISVKLYPFSVVAHEREVKAVVSSVLHAGESVLEAWGKGVWAWNTICGVEVEGAMVPLARDVYHVIELRILWRWLDVCGL